MVYQPKQSVFNKSFTTLPRAFYGDGKVGRSHEIEKTTFDRMSFFLGAPAGTRIPDPLIKSQMLYQLSYRGINHAYI